MNNISYISNSLKLKESPNDILKNHPKSEIHFQYNGFNSIVMEELNDIVEKIPKIVAKEIEEMNDALNEKMRKENDHVEKLMRLKITKLFDGNHNDLIQLLCYDVVILIHSYFIRIGRDKPNCNHSKKYQ